MPQFWCHRLIGRDSDQKGTMKQQRFVIVNTYDAPIRKHIAEWVDGIGYCYMSRTSLAYLKKFDGMTPTAPTRIEDFGFDVVVGETEATFVPVRESTAVYEDGKPRKWQERFSSQESFVLPLVGKVKIRVKKPD